MIIVDLDNCIANDEWRIPRIIWQQPDPVLRYHDYHSLAPWDKSANLDRLTRAVAVLTARPLLYRTMTEEWLRREGVVVAHLLMRNNLDRRSSLEVKRTQLDWLLNLYNVKRGDIIMAYDDRPEIVNMYLAAGIPAEVLAIHNISAYAA